MGYTRHHAIIVTSNCDESIREAHEKAKEIFGEVLTNVTDILDSAMNSYGTFTVCPDGGKEGGGCSVSGDKARAEFREWLTIRMEDEDFYVSWVEVQYGDDMGKMSIIAGN